MTNEQLAFVADALLALSEKPTDRPFYSDEGLRSKLFVAERRDAVYGYLAASRPGDPLLISECRDVFESAGLTDRQRVVFQMRMEGHTFEEIGKARGHSKQGAQHNFILALKKLLRAFHNYPFRGLSEVYRFESRRGQRRHAPVPARLARKPADERAAAA